MQGNKVRILTKGEVEKLVSMKDVIHEVRDIFGEIKDIEKSSPERSVLDISDGKGHMLTMPFYLPKDKKMGAKIVCVFPQNSGGEAKTISGILVLCCTETGRTLSIMDAESITSLRTGAMSAIGADYLSREDSKTLALFGAGVQGKSHVVAALEVRELERVNVFDLDFQKSKALAEVLGKNNSRNCRFYPVSSSEEALEEADIVVTATTSCDPVFDGRLIKEGTHVTAIGAFKPHCRELDDVLMSKAKIVVDSYTQCMKEAGDIIMAIESGVINAGHIHGELRELIAGEKKGRENEEEITLFKSVGLPIQDAALARRIFQRAEDRNIGELFPLHD